jgi:hypothetical protein
MYLSGTLNIILLRTALVQKTTIRMGHLSDKLWHKHDIQRNQHITIINNNLFSCPTDVFDGYFGSPAFSNHFDCVTFGCPV